jgi:hypothetical protein
LFGFGSLSIEANEFLSNPFLDLASGKVRHQPVDGLIKPKTGILSFDSELLLN